ARETKSKTDATAKTEATASTASKKDGAVSKGKAEKLAAKPDAGAQAKAAAPPAAQTNIAAGNNAEQPASDVSAELKQRTELAHDKFSVLDANGDGFVDRQEASASVMLKPMFAKFDADKDGKLSLVEFAAINDLAAIQKDQDKVRHLH
ncbi:MAG TPA: EF-hand domain-containing protein, partial [Rudaea sp.]